MIKLACDVPHRFYLAFSGGVDSLVAAHFFQRGKRDVHLLHFNHGCEYSDDIMDQCRRVAYEMDLPLSCGVISRPDPHPGVSLEDHWRRERYKFFKLWAFGPDEPHKPVVTCHHLDDAVETWVWSSLHGEGKLIPVHRHPYLRPFLLTEKSQLIDYAEKNNLKPVDDPYNRETHLIRNYIRSNLLPHAYYVNPGLRKVIKKKYLNEAG